MEIKHINSNERLRMMDTLWTNLVSEERTLELPQWHITKKELRKHFDSVVG